MTDRATFLARFLDRAQANGNTPYEELQGSSVLLSGMADVGEALGEGAQKTLALISPSLDATPGRRTLEDEIDEWIFDPSSGLDALGIVSLGIGSASAAAAQGLARGAKALKFKAGEKLASGKLKEVAKTAAVAAKHPRVFAETLADLYSKEWGGDVAAKVTKKMIDNIPHEKLRQEVLRDEEAIIQLLQENAKVLWNQPGAARTPAQLFDHLGFKGAERKVLEFKLGMAKAIPRAIDAGRRHFPLQKWGTPPETPTAAQFTTRHAITAASGRDRLRDFED